MSFVTNKGASLLNKSYWEGTTIKCVLLGEGYTPDRDHDFADDFSSEISHTASGYTSGFNSPGRKAISNAAAAIDNTNNRVTYTCTLPTWASFSTGPVAYLAFIEEDTNDAGSPIIAIMDAPDAFQGDGSTFAPSLPTGFCFVVTV